MTYDDITSRLASYLTEIAEEERLARAGIKPTPSVEGVLERHADLFSRETVTALREGMSAADDRKERDRKERVLFAILEGSVRSQAARTEEELLREKAKAGWNDLAFEARKERDPMRREALFAEQAAVAERLIPKAQEHERLRRKAFASFGFSSARDASETKKRVSYDEFLGKAVLILEETTGLYRRVMSETARDVFGRELGGIPSVHAEQLFLHRDFDHLFPPDRLPHLCKTSFERMGLDLDRATAVTPDLEERRGKDPDAVCVPVDAPKAVHLLLRPLGGYADYRAFMREGATALSFAYADPTLPMAWRRLPRSGALATTYGVIMEHLTENPLWLEHALHVPKEAAARLASWSLLGGLYRLRRSIALLTYDLSFDAAPYETARNRKSYAAALGDLTGFAHDGGFALEAFDPEFRAADDLRARIAAAQVEEHLVRTYGERWFLRRETGGFFRGLFSKGASWECEDLVTHLGMTRWDPLPLLRRHDVVKRLIA